MKRDLPINFAELDPLIPFITFENDSKVIFEFPAGVMGNFYDACMNALVFFSEIEVKTDVTLRFALKATCKKRFPRTLGTSKYDNAINTLEDKLKEVQQQIKERKLLN